MELLEDIGTVPEDVKTRILKERDLVTVGQWRKSPPGKVCRTVCGGLP